MVTPDQNDGTVGDSRADPPVRAPRTGRFFAALIIRQGKAPLKCTIRNISATGMGGRADPPPLAGEAVTVSMGPLGDAPGRVRWVNGKQFGIHLDTPIDLGRFNFSDRSWADAPLPDDPKDAASPYKPPTSTWRPGFKTR